MTSSAQNSKQYLAQQGSATVPAYSFLGDQDTGIYRSGANELSIATNGTQRAVVDSSGNVGIGTGLPGPKLQVVGSATVASYANVAAAFGSAITSELYVGSLNGNAPFIASGGANPLLFQTNGSERARIDSSGNLLVGTTNSSTAAGVGVKFLPNGSTGCVVDDAASTTNTLHVYNVNATNNGYRFYVNSNGGVYNYSANNLNLSDARTKKDIENAGPYLAKICAIPVRTFRYKDQDGDWTNVGVIAQEVEAVAPELVDPAGWIGEGSEGDAPLKAVYQTDLTFALMKAIQELKAQLDATKARIAALEPA